MATDASGRTSQRAFRLSDEEVDLIDLIAEYEGEQLGTNLSRADVIRITTKFYKAAKEIPDRKPSKAKK
jgi:hypothetical protein